MRFRNLVPISLLFVLFGAACAGEAATTTTASSVATTVEVATTTTTVPTTSTAVETSFPTTVETDSGPVTIETQPIQIVSLSPTATETLFAIGAGDQVVAVDEYSYYPQEAPVTDLSGFSPNVEAILSYAPDLLVISDNPNDLQASMEAVGVPVLLLGSAVTLDDVYAQIEELGNATGHADEAATIVAGMKDRIAKTTAAITVPDSPLTYYHELDPTYYSVTSVTFIGQIYGMLGLESIADAADPDGYGFPQLTEEYIVDSNPDFIFLADAQCCGESSGTVGARPGWANMSAVLGDKVVEVDADIASRWGPRTVDFIESIAAVMTAEANA